MNGIKRRSEFYTQMARCFNGFACDANDREKEKTMGNGFAPVAFENANGHAMFFIPSQRPKCVII